MTRPGDKVFIRTKDAHEEGTLIQSSDEKIVLIKLDNGYNIGFRKKDIKEMKLIEKSKEYKKSVNKKIKSNKNLKIVSILHCGGTIASKIDYKTGAVKAKFSPEELLKMFPELRNVVNLRSKLISNMLSENMRFSHYNTIAKEVEKEIKKGTNGIIITHGTDTLHYTSAALSFMLENLNIPILLVGAQRSSDRGSSDAFINLNGAVNFIVNNKTVPGVFVCMHNNTEDDKCVIISGVKARKMHSSRRDAFKAINSQPIALVSVDGKIEWAPGMEKNVEKINKSKNKISVKYFNENIKIGILKSHPQMFTEEFKVYSKFDGLILEGTGLGHFPTENYDKNTFEHELIVKEISKLTKKIPVVMTVQTIFGGVNMNVYSPGRELIELGVLGNQQDITTETAFIKLAFVLSNYPKKVKEMFNENLRGEISNKRLFQEKFL